MNSKKINSKKNQRIGLIVNTSKPKAADVAVNLCNWLKNQNTEVIMADEYAEFIGITSMEYNNERVIDESDVLIVLGGDGTMLATVQIPNISQIPILGVNLGSLGFMTEVTVDEIYSAIKDVLSGKYEIDERMMLRCQVILRGDKVAEYSVLNEVYLWRLTHMIKLDTYIDDKYFLTYNGDGVIISTPTGSTAYSLSVGGPIVEPNINAIILSPIASHALTVRPFIAHPKSQIRISVCKNCRTNANLVIDGNKKFEINPEHTVKISKAEKTIKLICSHQRNYYDILRNKLRWGERA